MNLKKSAYWIIGIILIAIIAFGGYKVWHHTMVSSQNMSSTSGYVRQTMSPTSTPTSSGLSNKSDTSNQQLDQDVQNIQNSMNQLQQDQSTTNTDVNAASQDTPQQ